MQFIHYLVSAILPRQWVENLHQIIRIFIIPCNARRISEILFAVATVAAQISDSYIALSWLR